VESSAIKSDATEVQPAIPFIRSKPRPEPHVRPWKCIYGLTRIGAARSRRENFLYFKCCPLEERDQGKNNCANTISTGSQISDMMPMYAGHGNDRPVDNRAEA
jgi:hypothetical protein